MNDPTYDTDEIKANPVWFAAWILSECLNDRAPLGWGKYIWVAESLARSLEMRPKEAAHG